MAGFIQNYVQGMVQNAAVGAATYAITTGGRVVGDAVIGAGDLIEGAGRSVGNSVEGYIDRYGNWIRSYGDGAIAATAASSGPTSYKTAKAPSFSSTTTTTATKQKALPSSKTPKALLPAPPPKASPGGKANGGRPQLKKSLSDSKVPLPLATAKALPSSGVKKALPAPSKGQLAKAGRKGVGAVGGAVGGGVDGVGKGVTGLSGAVGGAVGAGAAAAGRKKKKKKDNNNNNNNKAPDVGNKGGYAASSAGSDVPSVASKKTAGVNGKVGGGVGGGVPSPRTPQGLGGAGQKATSGQAYPKPFSKTRPDGKVVISKESRPGGAPKTGGAAKTTGMGGAKKDDKKGGYDFLKPEKKDGNGSGKGKDDKGGFDFMRLMAEEPKKKGPGSVAGSVKTNGAARKSAPIGGGKQETSGQYDFF